MENGNNIELNRTSLGFFEHAVLSFLSFVVLERLSLTVQKSLIHVTNSQVCEMKFLRVRNVEWTSQRSASLLYYLFIDTEQWYFSTFCCIRKSLNNKNNGNLICVFKCTIIIVNVATYRQFTNAAWDRIIKKKKRKGKKRKSKLH